MLYPPMFFLAQFSLAIAALGQGLFFKSLADGRVSTWLIVVVALVPWLVVYTIHFFNRPLFSFTTHHRVWLSALGCFAITTIVAESLHGLGVSPRMRPNTEVIARIAMHIGWLSFIPFYCSYRYGRPTMP